jgi:hypothetical protein
VRENSSSWFGVVAEYIAGVSVDRVRPCLGSAEGIAVGEH